MPTAGMLPRLGLIPCQSRMDSYHETSCHGMRPRRGDMSPCGFGMHQSGYDKTQSVDAMPTAGMLPCFGGTPDYDPPPPPPEDDDDDDSVASDEAVTVREIPASCVAGEVVCDGAIEAL